MGHENHYQFINHRQCEYFPCHQGIEKESFNCLFCYCPLYMLGKECGGNFQYRQGIKDCSQCLLPHQKENYQYIINRFHDIQKKMK